MRDPQQAAQLFADVFEEIHQRDMVGLPVLNPMLQVETRGFHVHEGRVLGVLITPWLMNVVLLPGEGDDWSGHDLGDKVPQRFPSGTYKFMINEVEGIGRYQAHSLFSPMREFSNQPHAVAAADAFLGDLLKPSADGDDNVLSDEELLGRITRGEEVPELDLDALEEGRLVELGTGASRRLVDAEVDVEERKISRRELLRGMVGKPPSGSA